MTTIEIEAPISTEADILERAADVIEEWGWCRHAPFRSKYGVYDEVWSVTDHRIDSYCAIGAIWRATYERGLSPGTWEGLCDKAGEDDDPWEPFYEATGLSADETIGIIYDNDSHAADGSYVASLLREIAAYKRDHTSEDR